ncbi:shootin-1-like, partial [Pseudophryne corroboree]|uniref:shootin-1-like n=1 Tax=Pseudophryne corroboree TaxID=495146 RepID=UPI0030818E95
MFCSVVAPGSDVVVSDRDVCWDTFCSVLAPAYDKVRQQRDEAVRRLEEFNKRLKEKMMSDTNNTSTQRAGFLSTALDRYQKKNSLEAYQIHLESHVMRWLVSHMVIEEVSFMQNNLEIEKTCRESAEALASQLNKENKNLKRISMLYMAKLGPDVITEEINLDEPSTEGDAGVCTSLACQQKLKELQEQILSVEEKKKTVSIELEDLRSKLLDLISEVNVTKKENVMLNKEVFDQRKLLEKYNR